MTSRVAVSTPGASAPLPVFSQAVKSRGMVYVSGNIGLDPTSWKLVEGGIKAQTVSEQLDDRSCKVGKGGRLGGDANNRERPRRSIT